MREFKALVALLHAAGDDDGSAKLRDRFRRSLPALTGDPTLTDSDVSVHVEIYRRWTRGQLTTGWLQIAEDILLLSMGSWLDYVESLNEGDAAVKDRLALLRKIEACPHFEPSPTFWSLAKRMVEEHPAPPTPAASPPPSCDAANQPKPSAKGAGIAPNPAPFFTRSQRDARAKILALADLFFRPDPALPITPRTSPLLVSGTGSGKTILVRSIAAELGTYLLRLTVSEWIPQGAARELTPSLVEVADALASHERVIVFLDELDKFSDDGRSWSRSSATEIFNLLERCLPQSAVSRADLTDTERKLVSERLQSGMFLIGSGAWQALHQTSRSPIGFTAPSDGGVEPPDQILLRAIREAGFPTELLGRFHSSPIAIPYPDEAETRAIFRDLGVDRLAERLGQTCRLETFSWSPFGFRTLESLIADLVIADRCEQQKSRPDLARRSEGSL